MGRRWIRRQNYAVGYESVAHICTQIRVPDVRPIDCAVIVCVSSKFSDDVG